jgi:hypothetical protein
MWDEREKAWQPDAAMQDLLLAILLPDDRWQAAWLRWRAGADLDRLAPGAFRLMPQLFQRLRASEQDEPWMGRLQGIHRHTWAHNQMLLRDAANVAQALQQAGVPVMLIKGAAMILGHYHDAGLCPTVDIDILVPDTLAVQAVACLAAVGYTATHRYEGALPEKYLRVGFSHAFRNARGNEIDLHWHMLYLRAFPGSDDAFWRHAIPATLAGVPVMLPSPTDMLLMACLHGLCWSSTSSIRWVADAAHLIRTSVIDWNLLATYAEWKGVALPLQLALTYLRDRVELPVPTETLQRIASAPVDQTDRWVLKTYSGPENLLWNTLSLWFRYARFPRVEPARFASLLAGFPDYLATYWALPSVRKVPGFALRKVLRRL